MYVKTKKDESQAGPILSFIIGLIFAGIPLGLFTYLFILYNRNYEEFYNTFWNGIIIIFFALFFFVIGIFILKYVFKKPVKKIAKLTKKTREEYNGKEIISMTFNCKTEKGDYEYECYTEEDNNFILDETYIIKIREIDGKVSAVFPYDKTTKIDNNYELIVTNREKKGTSIVTLGVILVIVGPTIIIWFKTIFDIINNTGYVDKYNGEYFFALILFTIFSFLIIIVGKKFISNTNNENKKDSYIDLSKYPILKEKTTYITKPIRKMRFREMKLILIYWIFIELFFVILCTLNGFNDIFIIIVICSFPLLFLEIAEAIILWKYYNLDEKSIKESNINVNHNGTLINVRALKIVRVLPDAGAYYIIDGDKNLFFKVINKSWSNKYIIFDYHNKQIGEIYRKTFSLEDTYIIRLVGKNPFAVRARLEVKYNYDVYNTNYKVIGNYTYNKGYNGMKSAIYENNKEIAQVQFKSTKFLYHFSSAEIDVVEDNSNKEEIVFIAMSVVLGNQARFGIEVDR